MFQLIDIPTEQTTAATDVILAALSTYLCYRLSKKCTGVHSQKAKIWAWSLGFLAIAAFFGSITHGFKMSQQLNFYLWQPLNLSLGLAVSLFVAGMLYDLRMKQVPALYLVLILSLGVAFYLVTVIIPGSFLLFIIYEGIAMVVALVAYVYMAIVKQQRGSWYMVAGILVTIIAAAIQASGNVRLHLIWEFDHNGIFHIVQVPGLILLYHGISMQWK